LVLSVIHVRTKKVEGKYLIIERLEIIFTEMKFNVPPQIEEIHRCF